ncbi:hypothetical protein F4778DRAFT_781883 [Xylariomycetidae sp. FL2044]|nr:hypothetical protein F4778DRAFT_781883 [Xylariomycetidae sp. FL2044]
MGHSRSADKQPANPATPSTSTSTTTTTPSGSKPSRQVPVKQPTTNTPDPSQSTNSTYQRPGPGFQHSTVNGLNPSGIQHPQFHHTRGPANPVNTSLPNSTAPPTRAMAEEYMTGWMPNQGQNFQPPVPDTTYGPIPHTWHPRFDPPAGGPQFVGGVPYPMYMPQPMQPPMHPMHPMSQPQTGMATAPMVVPVAQPQPVFMQPQGAPQGAVFAQPPAMPPMACSGPAMSCPGPTGPPGMVLPGNTLPNNPGMLAPDVMGIGKTRTENQLNQIMIAEKNNINEPQDFKPADDDPSRMYWCKEADGNWTQRNRYSIDQMENCRWYITREGVFYSKRFAD